MKYVYNVSYHRRQLYSPVPFLLHSSSVPPPFLLCSSSVPPPFLQNCCMLLALAISPEIMDGIWFSRCLNDRIEVPDMMRLFAGGTTTPLVVKIEYWHNLNRNFALFRGKIWLWLFYNLDPWTSKSIHYFRRYSQSKLDVKFVTHRHMEEEEDSLQYYIGWSSYTTI